MTLNKFRYIDFSFIDKYLNIDISKFYLIEKGQIAYLLFYVAMIFAYFASFNVWFMWPFKNVYPILTAMLLVVSMLFSNSMQRPIFNRKDFVIPILSCAVILFYQALMSESTVIGFILIFFRIFIFWALFRIDKNCFEKFATVLCKVLSCLLAVSLAVFVLYLMGFHLPSRNAEFNDWYYYTNYYFFLVSDGVLNEIIPRFHSVFLEPGHMGTAIVLLLATQMGKWKKWYNIILIVALLVSFSLAAYGLLTILVFLHMWIQRKKIFLKVVAMVLFIAAVVGGSFVYNGGDNMLNQLIVMRLEVSDSGDDIEGNNRVSSEFEAEFNSFMQSSDILWGRKMENTGRGGNAGYRVYIYSYGLIGFFLCYLFYFVSMYKAPDKRAFIAMMVLSLANFWVRAYPLWYGFFIPYYLFAYLSRPLNQISLKR